MPVSPAIQQMPSSGNSLVDLLMSLVRGDDPGQSAMDMVGPSAPAVGMAKRALPPLANAAKTQIIGTLPTYEKALRLLQEMGATERMLDFGAGLGKGAEAMGARSFEPFAKGWSPDYAVAKDIPSEAFSGLTNLNVLNVLPREVRDDAVKQIGRVMERGGKGIVTTRGKDVLNAHGVAGPEDMSIITSRNTYQKGFTKEELQEYLKYMLGQGYDISRLNLGPAGALIEKR